MMQPPCGGDGGGGEAVGAAMLQPPGVQATPGLASEAAPSAQSSFMVFCDLVPAPAAAAVAAEVEGDGEAGGTGGGGGGGGLEDPEVVEEEEEEEEESGAQAGGGGGGGGGGGSKSCTYQGCRETTTQVANQRKPWMCKRHRNKMYKDKYKRKKSDQALGQSGGGGGGGGGGGPASVSPGAAPSGGSGLRVETLVEDLDCTEGSISVSKQRTGNIGDRPAKPTLLEQVLNHKRLSLLRSPEVVQFLQKRQQLLSQQAMEQRQQHFSGAPV